MRVTLVLTHACNLACSYCYAGDKLSRRMPLKVGWKALQLAFRGPSSETVELFFFGGEPMLAFDSMAALTRVASGWARRRGRQLALGLTTNGTRLEDSHLRFLEYYGFHVCISLDGLAPEHDRHRPFLSGKGSGELVWRNVRRAAGQLTRLSVNMVLSPDTLSGALEAAERLRDVGVPRLDLSPDLSARWGRQERRMAARVYGQLAQLYLRTRESERPLHIHPFAGAFQGEERASGAFCASGARELAVAPSGNLYPCPRLVGPDRRDDLRIGNVEGGVCRARLSAVAARSASRLRSHGCQGACKCVPLMPGDSPAILRAHAYFATLAWQSLQAARTERTGLWGRLLAIAPRILQDGRAP